MKRRYIVAILSMAVAGFAASVALADGYYKNVVVTTTSICANSQGHKVHDGVCDVANVHAGDTTITTISSSTVCNTTPSNDGPYTDDSCTTLADGGTTTGGDTPTTGGNNAPAAVPPPPAGIFLCYSTDQVNPSVWSAPQAAALFAGGGYWQPYAVKGNVAGGTNVGGYHLVCNIASGQALGDQFADDGGETSNGADHSALAGVLGQYPVVSG